jgi:hypothetical protein
VVVVVVLEVVVEYKCICTWALRPSLLLTASLQLRTRADRHDEPQSS